MPDEQQIYDKIRDQVKSIMPDDAKVFIFRVKLYPGVTSYTDYWIRKDGRKDWFGFDDVPDNVRNKIMELCAQLQTLPRFKRSPFTHCEGRLTDSGEFRMEFANIPIEDNGAGLFMRRVSDLTWEEAKAHYITREVWESHVAKFGDGSVKAQSTDHPVQDDAIDETGAQDQVAQVEPTEDQQIFQEIGNLLAGIMPDEAVEIYLSGMFFPAAMTLDGHWVLKDGTEDWFEDGAADEVLYKIANLCQRLQALSAAQGKPFSHFRIRLRDVTNFEMESANIPEEDSTPGLILHGISDLSQEEAEEGGIPRKKWEHCVAKFGRAEKRHFIRRNDENLLTEDQKIFREIGKRLWSIFPEDANEIVFSGSPSPSGTGFEIYWVLDDGSAGRPDTDIANQIGAQIQEFCKQLQTLPIYRQEPFTHCQARMLDTGRFRMEFSYIPEPNV